MPVGEEMEDKGIVGCCWMKKAPLRLTVKTVGLWPLKPRWRKLRE
jgi:hypothetical protein